MDFLLRLDFLIIPGRKIGRNPKIDLCPLTYGAIIVERE